ncbi:lysoplasmalogenase [Electrophorus electricus]|uniref:lysoplasmalogenase n=1 Tax=Electrophorus electricus TaxID=8005 RepID=UPI0015D0AF65|nr:lysoplasmalogenase [Electrophorus electricus]
MDILDTDAYDRRQRRSTSCILFLYLLPFFASTAVYFYLWIPESTPSPLAAGVKSAPVLSLALLVLSYNGGWSLLGVAGGLVLSACGDACLIWKEHFLHGMACFALAHILYSLSFLSWRYSSSSSSSWLYVLYLLLWGVSGGTFFYLLPFLRSSQDPDIYVPAIGAYTLLITVMATLALRTRRTLVMLGGLTFVISDLTIALQMFKVIETLDYNRHIIMTTYYLAQLLIAVGDVKTTLTPEADDLVKRKRL